jgi:hypothetical protein
VLAGGLITSSFVKIDGAERWLVAFLLPAIAAKIRLSNPADTLEYSYGDTVPMSVLQQR